jgi:undecaprenyl-diphosphatase
MGPLEALFLGLIQGLAEFLPISSSGHLELGKAILGDNSVPEEGLLFTIVVHGATALSTIIVFWKDIIEIFKGLFQFKWNDSTHYASLIFVSMIPVGIVGGLFKDELESLFGGQILLVGCMLLVTGALLFITEKAKPKEGELNYGKSVIIGIAQAIAILPGISRSGSTIATSLLLGIDREKAARFSFLMVLPVILGLMLKEGLDIAKGDVAVSADATPLIIGFFAAFISGVIACKWMIKIVKNAKLSYFAIYCFVVGTIAIIANFL